MFKKTSMAVLGLVSGSMAFAGSMGPVCAPGNVTVPCEAKHWSFGLQALYLDMAEGSARAYRHSGPTAIAQINNNWDWGFRAEGAYEFNTGNDLNVNWTHINGRMKQSFPIGSAFNIAAQFTDGQYELTRTDNLDEVNAVLGQHVDVSAVNKLRFYGGLQYANIRAQADNFYPVSTSQLASSTNYYDNSDYKGLGPVLGLDYAYDATSEISLVANAAMSVLYGTSRMSTGFVLNPTGAVPFSRYASTKTVVPGFEAKLGANYAYSMPEGTLNLQAGYQASEYLNALQGQSMQVATHPVEFVDFAVYGPYFGLKYVGNV